MFLYYLVTEKYTYFITKGLQGHKYRLSRFYKDTPQGHLEGDDLEELLSKWELNINDFIEYKEGEINGNIR